MRARALLLLTLALGGCSSSGVVTDWISDDAAGAEPINYRYEIAKALDGIIGAGERNVSELEITTPRRVDVDRRTRPRRKICKPSCSVPNRPRYCTSIQ